MNVLYAALSILLYPLAIFNFDPKRLPKGPQKVVILVHGYFHNRSAWYYLQWYLRKHLASKAVFTLNLGHPLQSIEAYACKLEQKIAEIQRMAGTTDLQISLVGHSMGGLVCLHYAAKCSRRPFVQNVITIASPLQGTNAAVRAKSFSESGREMIPGSAFLAKLHKGIGKLRGKTRVYCVSCGKDWVVPQKCSQVEESSDRLEFSMLGHISVLYSRTLANKLLEWLS